MTENEAIKRVEEFGLHHAIKDLPYSTLTVKAFEMAIKALEEIQQYRAIDTVEECRKAVRFLSMDNDNGIIEDLQLLNQYQLIGTVKECREAMEKQKAKKPIRIDMCTCPNCGTYNETVKKRRKTVNEDIVYCWHCGQAMLIRRVN